MMAGRNSEILDAVLDELRKAGAFYLVKGKKHAKVVWELNDIRGIVVVPRTPSDVRSIKASVAFVRKETRRAGGRVCR